MPDMFHACTYVVIVGGKENLGFVLKSSVGLTVEQAGKVPLELSPYLFSVLVEGSLSTDGLLPFGAALFGCLRRKRQSHYAYVIDANCLAY